tara:strand:+ start:86 stop:1231 length:1146 start_codon:yes stop_codon:yes gene_type:complete
MNFTKFKESLKFKKYQTWKIIVRYIEYKVKNLLIDIIINFNKFRFNKKKVIDIGSYSDNSYINYLIYSLKDEYHFAYKKDQNTKKLFRRIGIISFFKYTICNYNLKNETLIKINMNSKRKDPSEILIDTNYFDVLYNKNSAKNKDELIMPYFMYPRVYNSFYKKINIIKKPSFNLRVFFSGSIVLEGYNSFKWDKDPKKFPNRINVINKILKEFKNEIFLINSKNDLKKNKFFQKRIIFCLHDKMIKKTSYKLNFKENFNLLSKSCFNLSCPGVVMPLCHHLIEGIKVGSIPITNCETLLFPNLNDEVSLQYSSLDQLCEKIHEALNMEEDKILFMRSKVREYYNENLSPEKFRKNFNKMVVDKKRKIICCDDHRSIKNIN